MKDIAKVWGDEVKLVGTDDQTDGIQNHLYLMGDLCRYAVQDSVIIVYPPAARVRRRASIFSDRRTLQYNNKL